MTIQDKLLSVLSKSGSSVQLSESDFSKSFGQLGLDSLDVYSFFTEIEIELGVKIQDDDIATLTSMNKVAEYVLQRMGS